MTSRVRRAAVAVALASGLVVGGVGMTQAFAQTALPSSSASTSQGSGSSNSNNASDNCPNDATNSSSSTSSRA
jgi:hypothetical protein